eukprot:360772-Chlamydomonas_euryale.AAC.3
MLRLEPKIVCNVPVALSVAADKAGVITPQREVVPPSCPKLVPNCQETPKTSVGRVQVAPPPVTWVSVLLHCWPIGVRSESKGGRARGGRLSRGSNRSAGRARRCGSDPCCATGCPTVGLRYPLCLGLELTLAVS